MPYSPTAIKCGTFAALVGIAEAVVLPIVSGVEGDHSTIWELQLGAHDAGWLVGGGAGLTALFGLGPRDLRREGQPGSDLVRAEAFPSGPGGAVGASNSPTAIGRALADDEAAALAADEKIDTGDVSAVEFALPILVAALTIISSLEFLNGFGPADTGDVFGSASATFNTDIYNTLDNAAPTDWSGAAYGAAYNYECQNKEQQSRAHDIAEADNDIQNTLKAQAGMVEQGRIELASARLAVIGAWALAILLYREYLVYEAADDVGAMVCVQHHLFTLVGWTCLGVITLTATSIGVLIQRGDDTKSALDAAIKKYQSVIDSVGHLGRPALSGQSQAAYAADSSADQPLATEAITSTPFRTAPTPTPPLAEEGGGVVVPALRHDFELTNGIGQGNPADVRAAQRNHLAVLPGVRGVGRVHPEAGGQHPVVGSRLTATLDMAQDGHSDLLVDPLLHLEPQLGCDPGKALMPEFVEATLAQQH